MTPTITVKEDKRYNTITVKEDKRYNGSIRRYFDLFHDHLDKCDGTDWDDVESDMYFGIEEYLRNCKSKIFEDIHLKVYYYKLFTKIKDAGMGCRYNELKNFIQTVVQEKSNITLNDIENKLFQKLAEINQEMEDMPDMIGTQKGDYYKI